MDNTMKALIEVAKKAALDAALFGTGAVKITFCPRKGPKVAHVPFKKLMKKLSNRKPDFDEATQQDMNRYLTNRPCRRRNTR